jgi:hypothetical protein
MGRSLERRSLDRRGSIVPMGRTLDRTKADRTRLFDRVFVMSVAARTWARSGKTLVVSVFTYEQPNELYT